jgi:hypothetical protein
MKWLVSLYPAAWRERYSDEFLALLEQHPASILDYLDVIASMGMTWLNPRFHDAPVSAGCKMPPLHRAVFAFPDNMRDVLLEKELYRTRMNNGVSM